MPEIYKRKLFIELAQPDENWVSRWVSVNEFVDRYSVLRFRNWRDRCRENSTIAKQYILEIDKSQTPWNSVDRIKLSWKRREEITTTQSIRPDIIREISSRRCVILWTHYSCDHRTEVDHKNWRKNDPRVMNLQTQTIDDFQPLSKPANDAKRQFCKECKRTGIRYDATQLWYTVSYTEWDENYNENIWCKWCFWYDPVAFRQKLFMRWNQNS